MNSIFLEQSIPQLLRNIESSNLSFMDLADVTSKHIELYESNTLAWVEYDLDNLRNNAVRAQLEYDAREYLRKLDGIPFGVKDIFNTKHFHTQMGSPLWKDFSPGNNARVVDALTDAGAIVVGKTVTAEFAVHALNETLNPFDPTRTPGTSSSGSAAAVAAGMVPFALATQTAGSIVRPASFCGVWGMKPSFGMIPRTGVLKTTDSLDTVGFLAAHGMSLRSILDVVRVKGPNYPYVYKNIDSRQDVININDRPRRIGFVKTHTWNTAAKYAQEALEILARKINSELGYVVDEVEWPIELNACHDIHSVIYNKSLSYYFMNEMKHESYITPIMRNMIEAGEIINPKEFKDALMAQENISAELERLFEPYDVVLSLGTSSSAPKRGIEELPDPSLIWTLGHLPVVAAPSFRCPEGLPFGVQMISKRWNDYKLLDIIEDLVGRNVLP